MKAQFEANGRKVTINASMEILNDIAIMATYSREALVKAGHKYTARIYGDWFRGIYEALDAKGYYDSVKGRMYFEVLNNEKKIYRGKL